MQGLPFYLLDQQSQYPQDIPATSLRKIFLD
jgi:hypothetical protein